MSTTSKNLTIFLCLFSACVSVSIAGEMRDGSSEKKSIVVPVPNAQLHDWERAYLKKHFPAHFAFGPLSELGEDHAFIAHEKQRKFFDLYSFTMRGKKIEVYFDISKQVEEEYAQSHAKPK